MTNVSNTCFKSQKNGMWASLLSLLENFLCLFQLITGNVNRLTGMDMGWRLHESIAKAVCTIFLHGCGCVCAQLCPILCDPMDCSLPGSLPMEFSRQDTGCYFLFLFQGIFPTQVSCIVGRSFTTEPPGKAHFPTRMLFNLEQFPLFL